MTDTILQLIQKNVQCAAYTEGYSQVFKTKKFKAELLSHIHWLVCFYDLS